MDPLQNDPSTTEAPSTPTPEPTALPSPEELREASARYNVNFLKQSAQALNEQNGTAALVIGIPNDYQQYTDRNETAFLIVINPGLSDENAATMLHEMAGVLHEKAHALAPGLFEPVAVPEDGGTIN